MRWELLDSLSFPLKWHSEFEKIHLGLDFFGVNYS